MVVEPARGDADYRMLFYNSDGSLGEMCGNGARCICRYGYENRLAGEVQRVETTAGLVTGRRIDRRRYQIRLNDPTTVRLNAPIEVDGTVYDCAYVELGEPGPSPCGSPDFRTQGVSGPGAVRPGPADAVSPRVSQGRERKLL